MIVYWDKNNACDYDDVGGDSEYVIFEDYAKNNLRISKKTLEVDIQIDDKWVPINKKVYKYE